MIYDPLGLDGLGGKSVRICPRPNCGGQMKPSKAIEQTLVGEPDFPGQETVMLSEAGPAKHIDCLKCEKCGHSVTA